MKKTFTLVAALALATSIMAQTTALDFTANDCDGAPHNLFSELDAGNVVIVELVMMGCQPCVNAGNSLKNLVLPNVSDPARVQLYSIGFTNSISCAQMNSWKTTNGFTHTVFAGMSAQTTHYGGMGMPTIAVVGGGSSHAVYYGQQGHNDSENPAILAAIETALAASVGIAEETHSKLLAIQPNPVTDGVRLNGSWVTAKVLDMQGRVVRSATVQGALWLDVGTLAAGTYTLQLLDRNAGVSVGRFVKD